VFVKWGENCKEGMFCACGVVGEECFVVAKRDDEVFEALFRLGSRWFYLLCMMLMEGVKII